MNFDTIPFKNPDLETFVGMCRGESFEIKSGEKRYFPSSLSQRFAEQLTEKLLMREIETQKNKKFDKEAFKQEMMTKILEPEMKTLTTPKVLTFREQVLEHELAVKAMLEEEKKNQEAKKIEALEIAKE